MAQIHERKSSHSSSLLGKVGRRISHIGSDSPAYQVFAIPSDINNNRSSLESEAPSTFSGTSRSTFTRLPREIPHTGCAAPPPFASGTEHHSHVDDDSYMIEFDNDTLWPCFAPNEGNDVWVCPGIMVDGGDRVRADWVLGREIGGQFGSRLIPPSTTSASSMTTGTTTTTTGLPPRLFDLTTSLVVDTAVAGLPADTEYLAVSHVWGDKTIKIPGKLFGVEWAINIASQHKLSQIFSACAAVGGLQYIWIDVLCIDQRHPRAENGRMRGYFENAAACLVWLENVYNDPNWGLVLHSIIEVNRVYRLNQSSQPLVLGEQPPPQQQQGLPTIPVDPRACFRLIRNMTLIERAPWFSRVWTLQEGVLPKRLLFVTPERYIIDRSALFRLALALGEVAQWTLDQGLRWGVGLLQELQRSEIWKMLKMKQLLVAQRLSFQHVFHALKTRRSMYPADRVFGIQGLIRPGTAPTELPQRGDIETVLVRGFYQMSVEGGDFASLLFLGGSIWHSRSCMGFLPSIPMTRAPGSTNTGTGMVAGHKMAFAGHWGIKPNGEEMLPGELRLHDVSYDLVTSVHCLSAKGALSSWAGPPSLAWVEKSRTVPITDTVRATDIARAAGVPRETVVQPDGTPGPGFLAAVLPWKPGEESVLDRYPQDFVERMRLLAVQTVVQALKCRWLERHLESSAVVVLWTSRSAPQLAVVTEEFDENKALTIMSRQSLTEPTAGCLVCVRHDSGLRKVGVGLGEGLLAKAVQSFVLYK